MQQRVGRLTALMGVTVLVVAACSSPAAVPSASSGGSTSPAASSPSSSGASSAPETGWPYSGSLKDGTTFTLKPEIAAKVKAKAPVNYVMSNASATTDLFSAQITAGYESTLAAAQAVYPLNAKKIDPQTAYDANQQISQIEALFNSNQVDCLSIMVNGADTFTAVTKKLMAAGVPVFTVGAPTNGNELQQFTQIPEKEGAQTAQVVLDYMRAHNLTFKSFAVSGGNPAATWAQGRMTSFKQAILAAIPDATFVTDETSALNTTFEVPKMYDAYKAFVVGHPDINVILSADQGAGQAARAIKDSNLQGKAFSIGWNVTADQLDAIDADLQIAAMDQKWPDQGGFGGPACATFFAKGEILPNTQVLVPVTKENSAAARTELQRLLGQ
jgi:ABC-type sugar transport system substrate-binding protein